MSTDEEQKQQPRHLDLFMRHASQWRIPRMGDIVEGTMLSRHGSVAFVDLGFGTGIIYGKEYQDGREMLKDKSLGNSIVAKIVELENEEGYIELSIKEAGREKFWKEGTQAVVDKNPLNLPAPQA